jgi:small GTP-binding protein
MPKEIQEMTEQFPFDVFLSHSSKDKAVVRIVAERLQADGLRVWFDEWVLKPGDSIPSKIEQGLEHSRVLVLCMSANAFDSDWAQLEYGTFRFRDPLNKERRFIPLRLDEAPIKGSLTQFLYINWLQENREQMYAKLLEACRPSTTPEATARVIHAPFTEEFIQLSDSKGIELPYNAFSPDGKRVLSCVPNDKVFSVRLWDVETGQCLREFDGVTEGRIESVAWSASQQFAMTGSADKLIRLWDVESGHCLRVFEGHTDYVFNVALSSDERYALSASFDKTIRLWDIRTGDCLGLFEGHTDRVRSVAWSADQRIALSCGDDNTVRLWDIETGHCLRIFQGHTNWVMTVSWSANQRFALSGSCDNTMRLWEVETGLCLLVFEGHTENVEVIVWAINQRFVLTGSADNTIRLWDVEKGLCLQVLSGHTIMLRSVMFSKDQCRVLSGDFEGGICIWDLSKFIIEGQEPKSTEFAELPKPEQAQYTNAKVLLVGDTNAGKTGLTHRLATGQWKPSEDSTVGAWSTQWQLQDANAEPGVSREIWLWDFGGQADQRLIHQLYMDRTALILLLFNADQEDVLPGLRDWQTALRRCVKDTIPHFIVAGRIDTGFKASRGKLQAFAKEQGLLYHETSAKSGEGCDDLCTALLANIPWDRMEKRTSPRVFKLIKDEILKLRDEGQVLHTFKELRELLLQRLPNEPRFTDDVLQTVIGLLDGPGVVKELDYGTYILLAPEWINAYAQAIIRTLRSAENDLGVLPLRSIAEGQLIYQSIGRDGTAVEMKRLKPTEERVVLGEMERQLEQRGLCLRQGDKLVFPSHCGRDRLAVMEHPSVFVSYAVKGFLDDIYATLVVKLADSESFQLKELWRDAADFETLADKHHMGLKLTRESGSDGEISVYFGQGVTQQEQVIFANYIHAHLGNTCEQSTRLRHYVCPHCHTSKGNAEVLMKKLLAKKQDADTECDGCGRRFTLWDALEQKFASEEVCKQVEAIQTDDLAKLDSRRKGKLLVLDVGARITSANQKWLEIPQEEDDGIDIMVEFTDEDGNGIGKGLCLQLKAGNSHLTKRKTDGVEIFKIKKQRWVKTWTNQPYPVMLVIGTFPNDDEQAPKNQKVEFADVRWMEISSVLQQKSQNGTKQVRQIEFKGQRLDMSSVRQWREKIIQEG